MDDDRKIRFVVAPLLFIASVLWGAWFDPGWHKSLTAMFDPSYESSKWFGQAVGLVAGGGLAIFAGGYVIGTLTVFVLWLCFMLRYRLCRGKKSLFHEVALPAGAFKQVWKALDLEGEPNRCQELYAGVVFDYGFIRTTYNGIHQWLFRRWNGFTVAANSIGALILSIAYGRWVLDIHFRPQWYWPVIALIFILLPVAILAWLDTMKMVAFVAALPDKKSHHSEAMRWTRIELPPS